MLGQAIAALLSSPTRGRASDPLVDLHSTLSRPASRTAPQLVADDPVTSSLHFFFFMHNMYSTKIPQEAGILGDPVVVLFRLLEPRRSCP